MIITIDGLAINGKSTLAEMISKEINFKNFNTGSIYRCIALEISNKKMDINNLQEVVNKLSNIKIDFHSGKTFLNNIDVSKEIRTEQISVLSTKYGTIPEIKQVVRKIQKNFMENNNCVMEGRDIATRIAPKADVKFYLYSDFEIRVERQWKQNNSIDINQIREDLKLRDDIDINGNNFIKPQNAIEIDTSNKNINEVYEIMIKEIKKRLDIK